MSTAQSGVRPLDGETALVMGGSRGISADRPPAPGLSVYALTKSAVTGFTRRGLARELGPRGITVYTVQPGPTDTDKDVPTS